MLSKVKIYISKVHNPAFNLAFESYLLKHNSPDTISFYLWQNDKTIVIGRHQNPYKECNLQKVKNDNVTVIRRSSGGGAVYHDLGNLNFTFIVGEADYDVERQCNVIADALATFGLTCQTSGRNDMIIDGAKFSGHAYMSHEDMFCHHGTLLVNSNLKVLSEYLTASDLKLKSKGIDSVRSRVVNLSEIHSKYRDGELSVSLLSDALIKAFHKNYPYESTMEEVGYEFKEPYLIEMMQSFETWNWNISESLSFDVVYERKFIWGTIEISFICCDGLIEACDINTDCLANESFEKLKGSFVGTAFEKKELFKKINHDLVDEDIKSDLIIWFDSLLLDGSI